MQAIPFVPLIIGIIIGLLFGPQIRALPGVRQLPI